MIVQAVHSELFAKVLTLADASSAAPLLREHLAGDVGHIRSVVTTAVRPKGGTGGLVTYALELEDGTRTFASARVASWERLKTGWQRLESERKKWRQSLRPGALVEDAGVLLTAFPLDRRLPLLRPYLQAEKAKALALSSGLLTSQVDVSKQKSAVSLASYRAERRAVLRWDFACRTYGRKRRLESLFVRLHGEPATAVRSTLALTCAGAQGLAVPVPLMVDTDKGIAVERAVGGAQTRSGSLGAEDAFTMGRLAAQLHTVVPAAGLPTVTTKDRVRQASKAVGGLLAIDPQLGERALACLKRVTRASTHNEPRPTRLIHGDLHHGQLVTGSEGSFLVDFDRAAQGCPAQDIGAYRAHLVLERPDHALTDFIAFAEGYSSRARWFESSVLHHHIAVELLCLADAPFRRAHAQWRGATQDLLDHAERHLDRNQDLT